MTQTKIIDYQIRQCPKCQESHDYKLKVFTKDNTTKQVMLFGGPGAPSEVMFTCSNTNKMFTYKVEVPDNKEIAGVATEKEIADYKEPVALSSIASEELKDWIKSSRSIALDFCKNMLSTSIGAIPVYFAILKFLGLDTLHSESAKYLLIMPPVMFLVAALMFVFALKPKFDTIAEDDFVKFKEKRLKQLNNYLMAGTIIFSLGIVSSIFIFLSAF